MERVLNWCNEKMEKWIQLNGQTVGKDKLARLIQYFSRIIWGSLEHNDYNQPLTDQFKTLEYVLGSFRKVLRFGRCLDVFYSSLKSIHLEDLTIRFTLTCSKLAQSVFLFCDHMLWLSRTGLFQNINSKRWTDLATKYWLMAITMNLIRDVYEISHLINLYKAGKKVRTAFTRSNLTRIPLSSILSISRHNLNQIALSTYNYLYTHRDIVIDTIKNVCDLFIPLTALGYTDLTPRAIGILGVISSIAGLIAVLEPEARLLPA